MDEFHYEDGEYHCNECEWWVPSGMEYLKKRHSCSVYEFQNNSKAEEKLEEMKQQSKEDTDIEEVVEYCASELDNPTEKDKENIRDEAELFEKCTSCTNTEDAKEYILWLLENRQERLI